MIQRSAVRCLLAALCFIAVSLHAHVAGAQTDLLPNLEPFPASDVQLVSGANGLELRFSTTSWNRGIGPMELQGGPVVTDGQIVYQNIYQTDGSVRQVQAGIFEYHPEHGHVHLENYATYTLQPVVQGQGQPQNGTKMSFCLLDNTKINTRLPNAAKHAVYQSCGADIQGISVGWGDTYRYYLTGQFVPFDDSPSGDYLLIIDINPRPIPNEGLIESDYSDNRSCALVRVDRDAMTANVIGTSCNPNPSVTISGITPDSAFAGTSVGVTISGSGFTSDMSVSFENGSGKKPVVSNKQFIASDTITATVTVPTGGSSADPVWDLRVGPAVKLDAFTVIR